MIRGVDPHLVPTVESPCVRNCCLNEKDVCLGCGRALAEILRWHEAPSAEREEILARAKERRALRRW